MVLPRAMQRDHGIACALDLDEHALPAHGRASAIDRSRARSARSGSTSLGALERVLRHRLVVAQQRIHTLAFTRLQLRTRCFCAVDRRLDYHAEHTRFVTIHRASTVTLEMSLERELMTLVSASHS